jgi:hypothetical protein
MFGNNFSREGRVSGFSACPLSAVRHLLRHLRYYQRRAVPAEHLVELFPIIIFD